jgi:hypothetical protein
MRLPKLLRLAPVALLASAAAAAEVGPCGELNRIDNLIGQVKAFDKGQIRVAAVDTGGEPVCCAAHLLVFILGADPGVIQCFAVSDAREPGSANARGFHRIDPDRIAGALDSRRGLLLTVRFVRYDSDHGRPGKAGTLRVRIDLSGGGSVRIER